MALAAGYIIINISEIIMAKRTYEELVQLRVYGLTGCAAGLLMPMLYSGQRGFASGWVAKYFFYAFYPLHLMVIWLLL